MAMAGNVYGSTEKGNMRDMIENGNDKPPTPRLDTDKGRMYDFGDNQLSHEAGSCHNSRSRGKEASEGPALDNSGILRSSAGITKIDAEERVGASEGR